MVGTEGDSCEAAEEVPFGGSYSRVGPLNSRAWHSKNADVENVLAGGQAKKVCHVTGQGHGHVVVTYQHHVVMTAH